MNSFLGYLETSNPEIWQHYIKNIFNISRHKAFRELLTDFHATFHLNFQTSHLKYMTYHFVFK